MFPLLQIIKVFQATDNMNFIAKKNIIFKICKAISWLNILSLRTAPIISDRQIYTHWSMKSEKNMVRYQLENKTESIFQIQIGSVDYLSFSSLPLPWQFNFPLNNLAWSLSWVYVWGRQTP